MPIPLDSTDSNADWIKAGRWDIPASNQVELRAYLADRGVSVEQFKALPVYRLNQHRLPWLAAFGQEAP